MTVDRSRPEVIAPDPKRVKIDLGLGYSSSDDESDAEPLKEDIAEGTQKESMISIQEEKIVISSENEDEDDNEYALDLDEIGDLMGEQDEVTKEEDEEEEEGEQERDEEVGEEIDDIVKDFPMYAKQPIHLKFLKFLDSLSIDPYSSLDLEIDNIKNHESYDESQYESLLKTELENLWETYCNVKINGDYNQSEDLTPLQAFVKYLVSFDGKFPKMFTDFSRRQRNDVNFKNDLIQSLDNKTKSTIYSKWIKFKDSTDIEREKLLGAMKLKWKSKWDEVEIGNKEAIEWLFANDELQRKVNNNE